MLNPSLGISTVFLITFKLANPACSDHCDPASRDRQKSARSGHRRAFSLLRPLRRYDS